MTVNGTHIDLTYKEYSLLRLLLENTNLVVTRETILRGEWNYDGFVMTDWWAMSNREGYEATKTTHAPMVSAGNYVFMVCTDCSEMGQDDVKEALENGEITRGDLQRNAMNVLHFILGTPSILRFLDRISEEEKEAQEQMGDNDFVL